MLTYSSPLSTEELSQRKPISFDRRSFSSQGQVSWWKQLNIVFCPILPLGMSNHIPPPAESIPAAPSNTNSSTQTEGDRGKAKGAEGPCSAPQSQRAPHTDHTGPMLRVQLKPQTFDLWTDFICRWNETLWVFFSVSVFVQGRVKAVCTSHGL